jgi:DNA polymerase III epsilon subunit-like protein
MEKKFVSFDVEASGRTPGKNSLLSIGACLADNPQIGFYTEIKPISTIYNDAAMRISSL